MKSPDDKRKQEKRVLAEMIGIYCRGRHHSKGNLCEECHELLDYAHARVDQCPFMEHKTFCSQCPVHCYSPIMREKIRAVMRYSGPRMLFVHPVLAMKHLAHRLKAR